MMCTKYNIWTKFSWRNIVILKYVHHIGWNIFKISPSNVQQCQTNFGPYLVRGISAAQEWHDRMVSCALSPPQLALERRGEERGNGVRKGARHHNNTLPSILTKRSFVQQVCSGSGSAFHFCSEIFFWLKGICFGEFGRLPSLNMDTGCFKVDQEIRKCDGKSCKLDERKSYCAVFRPADGLMIKFFWGGFPQHFLGHLTK